MIGDSSLRLGSVVTNDDITQLIVITKEDFLSLVSFIMQSDVMEKIVVLRYSVVLSILTRPNLLVRVQENQLVS
jgi:hypothetical protein